MYQPDLAYIQHDGFADFAAEAGAGVLALLRQAGIMSGHVVDLGCGDGGWLRQLTRARFSATGIEQSASLAKYARAAAPQATVRVASLHRTAFSRCDAITALGEVLSYLPSASARPSLASLFRRAHRALRPGGLLIFDLLVAGPPMNYRTGRAGPTWAVLADVREDAARRRLIRDITTFRELRGGYRRGHERHVLAVSQRDRVVAALRQTGFAVRTSRRYGGFALPPRRLAFMARKR
jgi:SAM-dependent methyltransferase